MGKRRSDELSYPPDGLGIVGIVGIDGMPGPGGIFMSFIIAAQQSIDWAAGGSAFIIEGQQLCREKSRYRTATMTTMPTAVPVIARIG